MKSSGATRRILAATLLVGPLLVLVACGGDDGETVEGGTLRLGHGGAPGDILTQTITEHFNRVVEEGTDGRWTVENYGSSQLGNERDLIEGVSLGTVDMTLVTNAPLGNFVPEALFYDLPGLYQDLEHVHAVAESSIIEDHLAPALLDENMRLLGISDGGFRNITNSRAPIDTVDDVAGLKMRVQESPMILATYDALPDVTPVPVPIGDLYTGLDQGIVDAQENPAILIRDFKLNEVQQYMTLTNHSYFPRHFLINEDVWQSMTDEDQQVFLDASNAAVEAKNEYYVTETEAAMDELRRSGMEISEPDDAFKDKFAELMRTEVYPQFYADIGGGDRAKGEAIVQQIIDLGDES